MSKDENSFPGMARLQIALPLGLVLVVLATCGIVEWGAHSDKLSQWLQERSNTQNQQAGRLLVYTGNFDDVGDRIMLGDVENLDASNGGVYLLGSSAAIYCFQEWRLTPAQAKLIHNLGFYSMNPLQQRQFGTFLTERESLLKAGPDKTMIMTGLSLSDMVEDDGVDIRAARFLPESIRRSGLYDYQPDKGISLIRMNRVMRRITYEEARCRSFLTRCIYGATGNPALTFDKTLFRQDFSTRLGPNWQDVMNRQLVALDALFGDWQSRHVKILPFFVPRGSWTDGLPAVEEYVARVRQICNARHLQLLDYSHFEPDGEYSDPVHLTADGTKKMHEALMPYAIDFLQKTGALPTH